MTVRELYEALRTMPLDADVIAESAFGAVLVTGVQRADWNALGNDNCYKFHGFFTYGQIEPVLLRCDPAKEL